MVSLRQRSLSEAPVMSSSVYAVEPTTALSPGWTTCARSN